MAAKSAPQDTTWHFSIKAAHRRFMVSAVKIQTTGWFVIILHSVD